MSRVLSVSCDPSRLKSRHYLLLAMRLDVTSALGAESAMQLCEEGGFDLLLLGQTVPLDNKLELIRRFRRYCSGAVLWMYRPPKENLANADYYFDSSNRPDQLVALISEILAGSRSRSVGEET